MRGLPLPAFWGKNGKEGTLYFAHAVQMPLWGGGLVQLRIGTEFLTAREQHRVGFQTRCAPATYSLQGVTNCCPRMVRDPRSLPLIQDRHRMSVMSSLVLCYIGWWWCSITCASFGRITEETGPVRSALAGKCMQGFCHFSAD